MKVLKASGLRESFRPRKIYSGIIAAGGKKPLAKEVTKEISKKIYPDITTDEILRSVLARLRKYPGVRARYNLKRAIMELGPTGFPFETFFSKVLENYGYKTKVGVYLPGKRIIHEIDIVAETKDNSAMIECKYHKNPGKSTDLHVAMYTHARFLDLRKKLSFAWLVTNTRCSGAAIEYAKGVNQKITSWSYPPSESLQKLIEDKNLYPITMLVSLPKKYLPIFHKHKLMLIKDVLDYSPEKLSKRFGLSSLRARKILIESKQILDK